MEPISLDKINAAFKAIDPVFLNTPQYKSESLSEQLGCSVICKLETANPIGCFKGRGADWWLKCFKETKCLVAASSGNFGQAVAYVGKTHGVEVHVFVAKTADPIKIRKIEHLGAIVHQYGEDFDAAKLEGVQFAEKNGWIFLEDGKQPEIAEGAGTIAVELTQYSQQIDVLYIPLGNGSLINGVGTWFKAHSPHTKIIGICAEGAPSMLHSWKQGLVVTTDTVDTIADGISIRIPVPESLPPLASSVDDIILISDEQIIKAMQTLLEHEQIITEPTGAVSLAAAMVNAQKHLGQTIGIIITGSNLDPKNQKQWLTL